MRHDYKTYSDQTLECRKSAVKKCVDDYTHELQLIREEIKRRKDNAETKTAD